MVEGNGRGEGSALDDVFVVDATVHAFNFKPENALADWVGPFTGVLHGMGHLHLHPPGEPKWNLSYEHFINSFDYEPELLARAVFAESQTDVAVYHGVPMYGIYGDGSSPIWVAEAIRERYPGRMFIYGDVSPWAEDALERVDELVEEHGVIGLKLYPVDLVDGEVRSFHMDDPELIFPICERAQQKGLKVVAIHKAVPLGPLPMEPFDAVHDVGLAAEAFPDLKFEIVHGGLSFLEETTEVLADHPNVYVNLEGNNSFAVNHPEIFGALLAGLLEAGSDRIVYASGAVGYHPQPALEAFWNLELPEGAPPLTEGAKRDILGNNFARMHGWDVEAMKREISNDEFSPHSNKAGLAEPWSAIPGHVGVEAPPLPEGQPLAPGFPEDKLPGAKAS